MISDIYDEIHDIRSGSRILCIGEDPIYMANVAAHLIVKHSEYCVLYATLGRVIKLPIKCLLSTI